MAAQPDRQALELRCLNARCATLLPGDAEICDECGGTEFARLDSAEAMLLGEAGERPVGFGLPSSRPAQIGRSAPDSPTPDVDLARFPGAESVHRRHAQIQQDQGSWTITHLGRNPVVLARPEGNLVVSPGTTSALRSGDWLLIGRIRLQVVLGPVARV